MTDAKIKEALQLMLQAMQELKEVCAELDARVTRLEANFAR